MSVDTGALITILVMYMFSLPTALTGCVSCFRLKEQKNLNSFFAVMFGLSNSAVQRLYKTWEVRPARDNDLHF